MISLRALQERLPWRSTYSAAFESGPAHRHFGHTVLHLAKPIGGLAELVDLLDHRADLVAGAPDTRAGSYLRERAGKYIADLVILAVRLAVTFPGGPLDLERAVLDRVKEKNGVSLEDEQ